MKRRNIFAELTDGFSALEAGRKGRIKLLQHKVKTRKPAPTNDLEPPHRRNPHPPKVSGRLQQQLSD